MLIKTDSNNITNKILLQIQKNITNKKILLQTKKYYYKQKNTITNNIERLVIRTSSFRTLSNIKRSIIYIIELCSIESFESRIG